MSRGAFVVSVLVIFCSVILFPSISISSVPVIVGQDDGGTGISPVGFNTGEKSRMSQGHQVNVNVTTGNLIVKNTDLVIPTRGKDIVIQRTYNSLEQLNGVEKGLDMYVQPSGWSDILYISAGTAWINGERAFLENDYSVNANTFSISIESSYTFYIYIFKNPDNTAGIDVTRYTLPQSAPSNYYLIGIVYISHNMGPEYGISGLENRGQSTLYILPWEWR